MATLKIKLCDLNRGDVGSIKSMFHLTAPQRAQDWEIVASGEADLCIYSFESEKSITAWQKHTFLDGLSVLLSTNIDIDVAMDMVLKKPLRTKNFSAILNKAAKQIKLASTIENSVPDENNEKDALAEKHTTKAEPELLNTTEKQTTLSTNIEKPSSDESSEKDTLTKISTTKAKVKAPDTAKKQAKLNTNIEKPSSDKSSEKDALAQIYANETEVNVVNRQEKQTELTANLEKTPSAENSDEDVLAQIYASDAGQETVKSESILSSVSSSLSKHFTRKKSAHRHLPFLDLTLPEQSDPQAGLIVEIDILEEALTKNSKNPDALIDLILENLVLLNRSTLAEKTRLAVLELYRKTTFPLMRYWETKIKELQSLSHANYLKTVHAFALLIDELAIGYKILLMDAYSNGKHPKSNGSFLIAINRVAEYSSLYILHCYCFLRVSPPDKLHTLHQLYLCCEAAKVLDIKISTKDDQAALSFSTIYNQIILTSIADPFRLSKTDILKLYRLMAKYTAKIKISTPTIEQKQPMDDEIIVGHFIIDTAGDNLPVSLEKLSVEQRSLPDARLLNTHAVLTAIEIIFQQAASIENDVYSSEIQLLKKVIPHINTSYERQFERFPFKGDVFVNLVKDIPLVHSALQGDKLNPDDNWNIYNRGLGGMMVGIKNTNHHQLDVGDFYGVFEANDSPLLALVRWLRINDNDLTMGLEVHRGHPVAVSCVLENQSSPISALILRDEKQADTFIAKKGIITIDQAFQITEDDKTYIISIDTLIDDSHNYNHFSFTII